MTISRPKSLLPARDNMSYIDHVLKHWSRIERRTAFRLGSRNKALVAPKISQVVIIEWES